MTELIASGTVTRVQFNYQLTLLLLNGTTVQFETNCTLAREDGSPVEFDPESARSTAYDILGVLHHDVEVTLEGSMLAVTADNGLCIRCDAHPDYDAWHVALGGSVKIMCPSGGEVQRYDGSSGSGTPS